MSEEIELLKKCSKIFNEMDAVIWNERSIWNESCYGKIANEVYQFLNNKKCTKKTKWFELTQMQPKYGVKYWLLFEDDSVKKGWFWEPTKKWFWDFKYKNKIKETVVMFAEIKPPEVN